MHCRNSWATDAIRAQEQNNLISISNGMQVLTRNFNWKLHENGWLAMRDVSYSTRSPFKMFIFERFIVEDDIKERIDQTKWKIFFSPLIIFIILFKKKKTLPIVISIYNIIQNIFWSKTYIRFFLLYISYSFSISYEIATLASREERKINGPSNWI